MIVLADTSVWIEHFRRREAGLAPLLDAGRVVMHPMVLGELALGALPSRAELITMLGLLRTTTVAEPAEVMGMVERVPLWGRGLGWVDAHVLASALLDRVRLWTLDRPLAAAAAELGVAFTL